MPRCRIGSKMGILSVRILEVPPRKSMERVTRCMSIVVSLICLMVPSDLRLDICHL